MHINENILLSGAGFKKQRDYWLDKLSGLGDKEETHVLFTNRRYSGAGTGRGQIDFSLPRELVHQVVKLGKESDLSIYILLLAGLKSLIYRYTGNEDIIVLSPLYRADVTAETINDVLLIRDALYEEMSFKELVLAVRESLLSAYENQDYPFDRLAEACLNARQLENNPFMTTAACVFENIHDYDERLAARLTDQVVFLFQLDESRLGCRIIFDPGRYEAYYLEKIPGHFTGILEQAVNDINITIPGIFYLSGQEKECLLYDYSNRGQGYPVEPACPEIFAGQVEKTPDKVALVYEDGYLTYRELNECSLRLAGVLRERGVTAGTIAALKVGPCFSMITGIMGILKAGGAFLPIGADYPEERIAYMLKDSGAKILLSELSEVSGPGKEPAHLTGLIHPAHLCYVIYTSGSTGRPKGVLVTHGNLTPMLLWSRDYFGLGEHTRVLQNLSYTFDFGVFELLTTILFGGTLYFFDRAGLTDARDYTAFIDRHQINTLHTTPSFLSSILSPGERMSSLRILHLGGERLSGTLIDTAARHLSPGCCIYNGYGPTETTINSSIFKVVPEDMSYRDSTKTADNTPIGKPSANNTVYILDGRRQLVPIGAAGELYIGGGGVAPGYLNRPEMTSKRFINYKLNEKLLRGVQGGSFLEKSPPGRRRQKLYQTGDLCCWLPGGNIEFLGRIDQQVKVRGFRVELGEIESRLLEYPGVKEALVIARDHFLCAYIVRGDTGGSFLPRLKEYLTRKLPDYMVPSYFQELDKIPLTPGGKADRNALPEPVSGISGEGYAAPVGGLEEELVSIWGELLGIEKGLIGVHADFFQVGGHSLLAMGLISKLHQRLDVKIPLGQVLQAPTIRELAAVIQGVAKDKHLSLAKSEEKEYYVLSSGQKRMYILQQMERESIGYNIPIARVFNGKIDKEKLEEVFKRLISRHESLRTSFHLPGEVPVQRIYPHVEFKIEYYDSAVSEAILHFVRPFELAKAPLLRAGLITGDENRHILMLDMHHIISDGVSMDLIVRDFGGLYDGGELPALRFRYRDYAEWQNKREQREAIKEQELFWLRSFAEEVPPLNLPCDYPRPLAQGFEGDSVTFEIEEEESESVHQLARLHGGTVYMVYLAVFYTWLARLGNQEDIVVGTPTAGRRHADLSAVVGMFVNTLALRNYPSGEKTFADFFEELKENVLAAFENQDYQFEDLVEKLSITRDTGRNPIFDVMFAFQSRGQLSKRAIETETDFFKHLEPYETGIKISKFDLSLSGSEVGDRVKFVCEYSKGLFKKDTIHRFSGYFKRILSSVTGNWQRRIWEADMLPEGEKRQLLYDFSTVSPGYVDYRPLDTLLTEQVRRAPGKVAVVYKDNVNGGYFHMTYRELDGRARRVARRIGQYTAKDKDRKDGLRIGLMFSDNPHLLAAVLGVIKSGHWFIPLAPDYPGERVGFMIADCGIEILLVDKVNYETAGKISGKNSSIRALLCVDAGDMDEGAEEIDGGGSRAHGCYIIYTSGSTGRPRGVPITRENLVPLLVWFRDYFKLGENTRVIQSLSYAFDFGTFEILTTFLCGGTLYQLNRENLLDFATYVESLELHGINTIHTTPSFFSRVVSLGRPMVGLRMVHFGGEVLTVKMVTDLSMLVPAECMIYNGYGPTEATVNSSIFGIKAGEVGTLNGLLTIPIGKPSSHNVIYVVDRRCGIQPLGVAGELCVSGGGLAAGYLNRPELTAEKFLHLTLNTQHLTLYKTGDLARWLVEGNIEFLGRIDQQVKIRGYRIEPGEIEHRLLEIPGIKEAVVIARKVESTGEKYLCAYLVLAAAGPAGRLNKTELRETLSRELPGYMVPSYFVEIERIPVTPGGKLDRRCLPEPETGEGGGEYTAPGSEVEERLVRVWTGVLGKRAGIHDNFFELGGHSLNAAVLVSRIHRAFDVRVPLMDFFKTPTIKGLSAYIKAASREKYVSITAVEEKEYYTLSSAQKRLYYLQELVPGSTAYNMPYMEVLDEETGRNLEKLEHTFRQLIRRHESLRTWFHLLRDKPVQGVRDSVDFAIEYYTVETGRDFVRCFDLTVAPLLRVGLINTGGREFTLMVDMHHIISDGISGMVLLRDFTALYNGGELAELRFQYKDYAGWQQSEKEKGALKAQRDYWVRQFSGGIPVLNLPVDYSRPELQGAAGNILNLEIGSEESRLLKQLASEQGTTLFMILLTLYNILLFKITGQVDIVVGIPTAGRGHADLEKIIGMFVNTLPLRNRLDPGQPFKELLEEVKERTLSAFENQDCQFEDIVESVVETREVGRGPLFDVMFALQGADIQAPTPPARDAGPFTFNNPAAKFDLTLTAIEAGTKESLSFSLNYNTQLFKPGTVERFLNYFKEIAAAVVENPMIRLEDIKISHDLFNEDLQVPRMEIDF